MIRRNEAALILVPAFLAVAIEVRTTAAQTPPAAAIAGRVTSADTGLPIGNAEVQLAAAEIPLPRSVYTDDEGRYQFGALQPGRYVVTVSAPYYSLTAAGQIPPAARSRTIVLTAAERVESVDFALYRYRAVEGAIVDDSGRPVRGVEVALLHVVTIAGRRRVIPVSPFPDPARPTDELGRFRLEAYPPGSYYLSAMAGAFAQKGDASGFATTYYPGTTDPTQAWPITIQPGQDLVGLQFPIVRARMLTLRGRLVDDNDRPVAGGTIALVPDELVTQPPALSGSKADGSFEIRGVPRGDYVLQAWRGSAGVQRFVDWAFGYVALAVDDKDVPELIVRLARGATLKGRIVFDGAGPRPPTRAVSVDAVPVEFVSNPYAGLPGSNRTAIADDWTFESRNQFGLRRIQATAGNLWALDRAMLDGRDVADTPLDFRQGAIGDIELVFVDAAALTGGVADEAGKTIPDAIVVLFAADASRWTERSRFMSVARTGAAGRFQMYRLVPASYYVIAVPPAQVSDLLDPAWLAANRAAATPIELRRGETRAINLKIVSR